MLQLPPPVKHKKKKKEQKKKKNVRVPEGFFPVLIYCFVLNSLCCEPK